MFTSDEVPGSAIAFRGTILRRSTVYSKPWWSHTTQAVLRYHYVDSFVDNLAMVSTMIARKRSAVLALLLVLPGKE